MSDLIKDICEQAEYPTAMGKHWCIVPVDTFCTVNATKPGTGIPVTCGGSIITAGSVVYHYGLGDAGEEVYWCVNCAIGLGNTPPPNELLVMAMTSDMNKSKSVVCKIVSFGYKNGIPKKANGRMILDVRKTIRNPWSFPELKSMTGLDKPIQDFVSTCPKTVYKINCYLPFVKGGKELWIGCQGGKHRSVALAELMAERLRAQDFKVEVIHRDLKIKKPKKAVISE